MHIAIFHTTLAFGFVLGLVLSITATPPLLRSYSILTVTNYFILVPSSACMYNLILMCDLPSVNLRC
ncbi:hypothetical protein RSAG8_06913, partial [Rhizoctonia solani AG-8 WAC10335]